MDHARFTLALPNEPELLDRLITAVAVQDDPPITHLGRHAPQPRRPGPRGRVRSRLAADRAAAGRVAQELAATLEPSRAPSNLAAPAATGARTLTATRPATGHDGAGAPPARRCSAVTALDLLGDPPHVLREHIGRSPYRRGWSRGAWSVPALLFGSEHDGRRPTGGVGTTRSLGMLTDAPEAGAAHSARVRAMPDQLLDRILTEIRERLDASREAYEESQRLEAALTALGSARAAEASRPRATSRCASSSRSSARAPRGENLRRIREVVAERPGATAGEIASATGVARPTVASTLGKLARDGELEKTKLPSGAVGYRPAASAPAADAPASEAATTPVLTDADAQPREADVSGSGQPGEPEASPEPTARPRKPRA